MKTTLQKMILIAMLFAFCGLSHVANAQWTLSFDSITNYSFYSDGNDIYIGNKTNNKRAYKSSDNGSTWTKMSDFTNLGTVYSFVRKGNKLFAATDIGGPYAIYSSSDDGLNWDTTGTGFPLSSYVTHSLKVIGNNIVAAGKGIYYSSDDGVSWTPSNITSDTYNTLAVNGTDIFAGSNSGGIIKKSSDNGMTWADVTPAGTSPIFWLTVKGTDIFAATVGEGVYISTDNGTTWTASNNGLPASAAVESFAIDGSDIYTGIYGGGVFKSSDNGNTWSDYSTGLISNNVFTLGIHGTTLFAGCASGKGLWKRDISTNIYSTGEIAYSPKLFPNPTTGKLVISENETINFIEIYNVPGELVVSYVGPTVIPNGERSLTFDLSAQPSGIYFVQMHNSVGISVHKVIKE